MSRDVAAYVVCVVNPSGEIIRTYEGFETLETARAFAAHNVRRQDRYVCAVIYQRHEMVSPNVLPTDVLFSPSVPALPKPSA